MVKSAVPTLLGVYKRLPMAYDVFLHADLGLAKELAPDHTNQAACELLAASLANHNVIVPTFTYSFCDGVPFDVQHSRAERVGLFPEWWRTQYGNKRTQHGIFSVAGNLVPAKVGADAFGQDSIFDWLRQKNATIMFMHCSFQRCTFVHYVEQCFGVDYRVHRDYTGVVIDEDGAQSIKTFGRSKRVPGATTSLYGAEYELLRRRILKFAELGKYGVLAGRAQDIFDGLTTMLHDDPYSLVQFAPKGAA